MKTVTLLLSLIIPAAIALAEVPVKPVSGAVAPSFSISVESAAAQKLWPEHRERLVNPLEKVAALHASPKKLEDQAKDQAVVTQLLAEPTRQVTAKELKGEWRVRSLQGTMIGDSYGVFLYPWFKARITEKQGGLFFEKVTGSQRRSGWLYAPEDKGLAWIFAGGWSVNEDPQVPYSREAGATAARETDSVGLLLGLKGGRLMMVSDVTDKNYEIYELKR